MSVRFVLTLALVALMAGCAGDNDPPLPVNEVITSFEADGAPLTVTVLVNRRTITIADSFRCTIEITRGKDVVAALPEFTELEKAFAPLVARDRRTLPERIKDGAVLEAHEYELEPLVSGDCTIKPFTVAYTLGDEKSAIETEPITLSVTSLGAGDPRAELRDIAGPVSLDQPGSAWWLWLAGAGGVVVVGIVAWRVFGRRRPSGAPVKRLAPHEIAFEALRALREQDYIGRDMLNAFYIELSAILRRYIERRFGLHAPEQTTEEFLDGISRDGFFDLRRRMLLAAFLEHCDLVKFAKYGPTPDEIQQAFTSATTFIDETKQEAAADDV